MPRQTKDAAGLDAVFEAIAALTFREHRELAELLTMQVEDRELTSRDAFADLIADTCDSFLAASEED
ncbi:hypothetical protein [Qipengyuania sp. SM2507]